MKGKNEGGRMKDEVKKQRTASNEVKSYGQLFALSSAFILAPSSFRLHPCP